MTDCKFQPGTYWRTRDGRKAYITAVCLNNPWGESDPYVVLGFIQGVDYQIDDLDSWTMSGASDVREAISNLDLIAPWEDEADYAVIGGKRFRLVPEE